MMLPSHQEAPTSRANPNKPLLVVIKKRLVISRAGVAMSGVTFLARGVLGDQATGLHLLVLISGPRLGTMWVPPITFGKLLENEARSKGQ